MNILITGGAGFIGSKIATDLHKKGHNIFVIDDLSNGKEERIDPEWTFIRSPLTFAFSAYELPTLGSIDLVIHCAAQIDVRTSIQKPLTDCDSNIMQSILLLQNMIEIMKCDRIIFLSSAGALYDLKEGECCATEDSRINPLCPYGVSKRAFELYLNYYKHQFGIKPTILRLANVYGRDNTKGVCRIFVDRARKGEDLVINGGCQVRDFIHVDDVVSAVSATLKTEGIFNVGTGEGFSMVELASIIKHEFKSDSKIIKKPMIKGEVMRSVVTPERLFRLGWKPLVNIYKGLKTVDKC